MYIHYVEDVNSDVIALKRSLRRRSEMQVKACARMDQLQSEAAANPIDVLLVDIMRPDALSIEDDVRLARRVTEAPILFLTGLNPEDVLDQAIIAGADGVISKNSISADLICQFVDNARVRARHLQTMVGRDLEIGPDRVTSPRPKDWLSTAPTLADVDGPLAYLEAGLQTLLASAQSSERQPWRTRTGRMLKTASRLRRLGARSFEAASDVDASLVLTELVSEIIPELAQDGITVCADIRPGVRFTCIGDASDAAEGLDAFLSGVLGLACPGDRLRISLSQGEDDEPACLVIRSSRALIRGPGAAGALP